MSFLVLDLDETLLQSTFDFPFPTSPTDRAHRLRKGWTLLRPHCREFLNFCSAHFLGVIVWSAGSYDYVHDLCRLLFPVAVAPSSLPCGRLPEPPMMILTGSDLTYDPHGQYDKPLSTIFTYPQLSGIATPENTLILDDRQGNFRSNPENGIRIPKFQPFDRVYDEEATLEEVMEAPDTALLEVQTWFQQSEVKSAPDVRKLKKPFTSPDLLSQAVIDRLLGVTPRDDQH